jgi:Reverse transcriptase (RNA-dependent DNA polymerase)
MMSALREHIGKICHIYLDNIIIWSHSISEHKQHITSIIQSLRDAKLFCNASKCQFFLCEIDFLGHHISICGIELNLSKIDHIKQWPVPMSATNMHAFLGLVRYVSAFLPGLAEWTAKLTPLTSKDTNKLFSKWTTDHQVAFDRIKDLVLGANCLTMINHITPGKNLIFVTCDTSN